MPSGVTTEQAASRLKAVFGPAVYSDVRPLLATLSKEGYDLGAVVVAILGDDPGRLSPATRVVVREELRRGLLKLSGLPRPSARLRDDLVDRFAGIAKSLVALLHHPRSAELFPAMAWPGAERKLGPSEFADRLDAMTQSLVLGAKELPQPVEPVFSHGKQRGRPRGGKGELEQRLSDTGLPRKYRRKLLALLFR